MKNYYQILGVQPSASFDEIRSAYLKLSKRVHPDVNFGGEIFERIFKDVNEAYQVLSNATERTDYNHQYNHFFFAANAFSLQQQSVQSSPVVFRPNYLRKKIVRNTVACIVLLFTFLAVNAFVFQDEGDNPGKLTVAQQAEAKPAKRKAEAVKANTERIETTEKVLAEAQALIEDTLPLANAELTAENEVPQREKVAEEVKPVLKACNSEKRLRDRVEWNETNMHELVTKVKAMRADIASNVRLVRIVQSETSNVSNAFDAARYLQQAGFFIAGRETTDKEIMGMVIDASSSMIVVTVGKM